MCNIETSSNITVLTIPRSELGDSGCYSLLVSNASGFDEFHVNVQVVGEHCVLPHKCATMETYSSASQPSVVCGFLLEALNSSDLPQ